MTGVGCGAAGGKGPVTQVADSSSQDSNGSATPDCDSQQQCSSKCEAGEASSCEWLGYMHETGEGAPQNYAEAARYYDLACSAGRDEACAHLAMMYDIGLAVEEDPKRAAELYDKACKAGNTWACNREGEIE
jgi:hypothetical protein